MYVCVYVCLYVYVCVYLYIYTYSMPSCMEDVLCERFWPASLGTWTLSQLGLWDVSGFGFDSKDRNFVGCGFGVSGWGLTLG